MTKVDGLYTEVSDLVDGALTVQKENLAKHGEFETLFGSFADKVGSLEERLKNVKPLSTKLPEIKAEQEELMVSQISFICIYYRICIFKCLSPVGYAGLESCNRWISM